MRSLTFIILATAFMACSTMEKTPSSMNVILIITDDQGYGDLGSHGNSIIQTPNLDRLYNESVRFTNFHTGTTCSPTRAGLMSGMLCNRVGAWHTIIGRSFLSTRFQSMAKYFQNNGYKTGIFGKWHLGDNYPYRPQDRGFDEVVIHGGGGVGQTPDLWNNDYFADKYLVNGNEKKFEGFCTDIWFEEALRFIQKSSSQNQPFFTYLSTNAPHGPHHAPQRYIDMYDDNEAVPNPNFYGQITNIDDNIGMLMDSIGRMGLLENTLVIFMSDNGTARGANLDKTGQVTLGYNANMRGKKGSEYEGGHRVAFFMRFPDRDKIQSRDFNELTTYTDVLPTLLELNEIPLPTDYTFDGLSLMPLLQQGQQAGLNKRILIVDTQREDLPRKWKNACVMKGHWRLMNNTELYDLSSDPSQKTDLFDNHPDLVAELSDAYEDLWDDLQSDMAQKNRIIIGSDHANPVLLTSHDWHTSEIPPWHQIHIRNGVDNNGFWEVEIENAGEYGVRLYRWPPNLQLKWSDTVEEGHLVDGGTPMPPGKWIHPKEARLSLGNSEWQQKVLVEDQYFQFHVTLEKGPASLQTWIDSGDDTNRGAYYVEVVRSEDSSD